MMYVGLSVALTFSSRREPTLNDGIIQSLKVCVRERFLYSGGKCFLRVFNYIVYLSVHIFDANLLFVTAELQGVPSP